MPAGQAASKPDLGRERDRRNNACKPPVGTPAFPADAMPCMRYCASPVPVALRWSRSRFRFPGAAYCSIVRTASVPKLRLQLSLPLAPLSSSFPRSTNPSLRILPLAHPCTMLVTSIVADPAAN